MHLDGRPERRGSQGRVADSKATEHEPFIRRNITLSPEIDKRLAKFCEKEERAMSWAIQHALDEWLKKKGY